MSALRAENLSARYAGTPRSRPALVDIDLELQPGERLLLLGPNGAGKSTFIRVFAGLMRATRGKALIGGTPARAARQSVGVVSHASYLYDELTALENLRFYAELYTVPDPVARAESLLDQVGISHLAHVQVGHLSRGQQQRVSIARALLHEPPVLLLDEPDTGLDAAAFDLVAHLLTARPQQAMVLTTHNLTSGLRLGTRVGILSHGRLVHQQQSLSVEDGGRLAGWLDRLSRE
ncbi:MAG TPA: heme ABC exporter ATP-binding protein CcmA [Chloroflexota bacterium]